MHFLHAHYSPESPACTFGQKPLTLPLPSRSAGLLQKTPSPKENKHARPTELLSTV